LYRGRPGFKAQFPKKWDSGDFSGGCARESSISDKNSTFLSLKMMKVGEADLPINVDDETESSKVCLVHILLLFFWTR
jgi:hypothetical protein